MNIVTTNRWNRFRPSAFVITVLVVACQRPEPPRSLTPLPQLHICSAVGGPPALVVAVRDDSGRPAARGTSLETRDERGHVNRVTGLDVSNVSMHSRPGRLRYRVRKNGFDAPPPAEVFVHWAGCSMVTEYVNVTLRRRADAAPLRMIAIPAGGDINFGAGEYSLGLRAVVDADPGVDTTVTWQSSDTRIVTVSADGVIRSRCIPDKRKAVVTATTRAPPHLHTTARITVWGDSTCKAKETSGLLVQPSRRN